MRILVRAIVAGAMYMACPRAVQSQSMPVPPEAALAALNAATSYLREIPMVILPDSAADMVVAHFLATARGTRTRTAAEARSCIGFIPHCNWRQDGDTTVTRVTLRSVRLDTLVFTVDMWGRILKRDPRYEPTSYYERSIVEVVKARNGWVVIRCVMDFAT